MLRFISLICLLLALAAPVEAQVKTVTGAVRLSMVDGSAFFWMEGEDLTAYSSSNYRVVITDSAGLRLQGYVFGRGTAESYASESVTNGTFETGSPPASWEYTPAGGGAASADVPTGGGTQSLQITRDASAGQAQQTIADLAAGKLVYFSGAFKRGTGTSVAARLGLTVVLATRTVTSWATLTAYRVVATETFLRLLVSGSAGQTGLFDNISLRQVTGPPATGLLICAGVGSAVRNWTSEETSFNRNDSAYTVQIYSLGNPRPPRWNRLTGEPREPRGRVW
jgi:hypothetical protein